MYFHPEKILYRDISFIFSTTSVSVSGCGREPFRHCVRSKWEFPMVEVFLKINPSLLNSMIDGIIKQTNLVLFNNFQIKRNDNRWIFLNDWNECFWTLWNIIEIIEIKCAGKHWVQCPWCCSYRWLFLEIIFSFFFSLRFLLSVLCFNYQHTICWHEI